MNAGVTEAGCLAHARRKFHEVWVHHSSTLAEQPNLAGRSGGVNEEQMGRRAEPS